jgi:hypothetical protein
MSILGGRGGKLALGMMMADQLRRHRHGRHAVQQGQAGKGAWHPRKKSLQLIAKMMATSTSHPRKKHQNLQNPTMA